MNAKAECCAWIAWVALADLEPQLLRRSPLAGIRGGFRLSDKYRDLVHVSGCIPKVAAVFPQGKTAAD
jgi:hypothetical protein